MTKNIIDKLVCPFCKVSPTCRISHQTTSGVIKRGSLYCDQCKKNIASIRHGKVDFLRVDTDIQSVASCLCDEFHYMRLPWNHASVSAVRCSRTELGWNPNGFAGCLKAVGPDWSICIKTEATDLSLRFLSNDSSGCVSVIVDDDEPLTIDLYSPICNEIKSFEIFCNRAGKKTITIRQAICNPASKGCQIYFFGMDAVFPGKLAFTGKNRGNGFPQAYKWVLDNLAPDAIVLDCGSGDRTYPDQRVISFEYMPFELPDVFGDGHALPFADAVFDAVFSQAVMEHMRNPYIAAREIARITKPGGLIYVESAFMQPLHAVPYHFFNTTTWGIEALFCDASVDAVTSEWFGRLSSSVDWYLNSCGGGGLSSREREQLRRLFLKVDSHVTYDQLKSIASGVAFWGVKSGGISAWVNLLAIGGKPSYKFELAQAGNKQGLYGFVYRMLRLVVKKIIGRRQT